MHSMPRPHPAVSALHPHAPRSAVAACCLRVSTVARWGISQPIFIVFAPAWQPPPAWLELISAMMRGRVGSNATTFVVFPGGALLARPFSSWALGAFSDCLPSFPLPPDVQFPSNNDGYHATSNSHHMPGIDDAQTGAGAANQFYY